MRRLAIVGSFVMVLIVMVTIPLVTAQAVDERCDRLPPHPRCPPTTTVPPVTTTTVRSVTTTVPPVTTTTVPPGSTTTVPPGSTTTVPQVTTTTAPSVTTTTAPSVTDPTEPSVTTTTVTTTPPRRRRAQPVLAPIVRPRPPVSTDDAHELIEIVVEQDFHHIGDGEGLSSFLIPDAEGLSWEVAFQISPEGYEAANTAHLELFVFDSGHLNAFVINGRSFALPSDENVQAAHLPFVSKMLISIPLGLLHSGPNTIGFESGQSSATSGFDDFEFGEVILLLSS